MIVAEIQRERERERERESCILYRKTTDFASKLACHGAGITNMCKLRDQTFISKVLF